jgi:hypothetical protein
MRSQLQYNNVTNGRGTAGVAAQIPGNRSWAAHFVASQIRNTFAKPVALEVEGACSRAQPAIVKAISEHGPVQ